jgi:hypothetical protein
MKVYINCYRSHWLSPYTILKFVCFWEKDDDIFYNHEDKPDAPYEKWVNRLQPICEFGQKVMDKIHPKIDYVKIDRWDTWSMDHTLGQIALPMLKQLNATKHGAPFVDDEDVPEGLGLRSIEAPAKENEWDTDENHFKRWDWVMNEMIFAFEHHINKDWEEAYRSGEIDWKSEACEWDENGKAKMYKMVDGPKNTYKCDYDGMRIVEDRIKNGFKLFGKYYQALWD